MNKLTKVEISEKEYFNKIANKYDKNYHYLEPFTKYKINKKALEFVRLINGYTKSDGLHMLEVGCGTGEYTRRIAKLFPKSKITGLDISEHVVSVARIKCKRNKNVSFVVKSAYHTGFAKESFDVIFGFYVLHHLSIPKFRKEMFRVLKSGGVAFFYEPNLINPAVYLIKSNKYLKKKAGDSIYEWAVNPLTIEKNLTSFKMIKVATSEYILPLRIIPLKIMIIVDTITDYLKHIPFIKYFGGSVYIFMTKK